MNAAADYRYHVLQDDDILAEMENFSWILNFLFFVIY